MTSRLEKVRGRVSFVLALIASIITIAESRVAIPFILKAFEQGSVIVIAVVLFQTHWVLMAILGILGWVAMRRAKSPTPGSRLVGLAFGAVLGGFALATAVRLVYWGLTGEIYPGQTLEELRIQTIISGIVLAVFGLLFYVAAIASGRIVKPSERKP